jgi:hypothetical protein
MTSQFWKWLSRANARTALLAGVIAFIVAVGYWVWREVEHRESAPVYSGGLATPNQPVTNRVELLAFIKIQQQNREKAMNNPFYRKPPWKPEPRPADSSSNPSAKNPQTPVPPPPPPKPPPPPPPPPPKEAPVMYRGIMTRPDGALTALIENQKTKKQHFFTAGEKFLTGVVEQIEPDSVHLRLADGGTVVLGRGQVVKIREE